MLKMSMWNPVNWFWASIPEAPPLPPAPSPLLQEVKTTQKKLNHVEPKIKVVPDLENEIKKRRVSLKPVQE